jgi:hypothetical protein
MATIRGGDKLHRELAKLTVKLRNPGTLSIGFLSGATYPVNAKRSKRGQKKSLAGGIPVAMIAAIQEFGAPSRGIPPRPFFRSMIKSKSGEWPRAIANLLKANGYDARRTLMLTGEAIAGQLRQSIKDTNAPPLKPATINRKGHSKPLVDTGHMLASIDYEVK